MLECVLDEETIQEEAIRDQGAYAAPRLTIRIPDADDVLLVPRAMVILGGLGRVDMRGRGGAYKIVLNDNDQPPRIHVSPPIIAMPGEPVPPVSEEADGGAPPSIEDRMRAAQWCFVPPDRRQRLLLVTEETFIQQLQGLTGP